MSFQFECKSESKFMRLPESVHQGSAKSEWEQRNFPDARSFKEVLRKTEDI